MSPATWALPNHATFPAWLGDTFKFDTRRPSSSSSSSSAAGKQKQKQKQKQPTQKQYELMVQQRFVRDYLQRASPYRGLVLYHGLGSGKTCAAIAASEALRGGGLTRVVVLLPASLQSNYVREVKKCGGAAYSEAQSWRFMPILTLPSSDAVAEDEMEAATAAADPKILKAHGGRWVAVATEEGGTPFHELNGAQRAQVVAQVDSVVRRTHRFINYNGLTAARVRQLNDPTAPNPFDDSVVVVDEAHGFIVTVGNGGLAAGVYQRIMEAQRAKVVLLSGTPLVNQPRELALLANLAHGYLSVHDFVLRTPLSDSAAARLLACPVVHEVHTSVRGARPVVSVRMLPEGFVRMSASPGHVARNNESAEQAVQRVREALLLPQPGGQEEPRVVILEERGRRVLLLPNSPEEFNAAFVDANGGRVVHADVLARRLLGMVSFFKGHDAKLYPKLRNVKIVHLPLSARQAAEYSLARRIERQREDTARRMARFRGAAGKDDDSGASYRSHSRAVCNFAFPEDVPRPRMSDVRINMGMKAAAAATHDDDDDGDDDGEDDNAVMDPTNLRGEAARAYANALDTAIDALRAQPGRLKVNSGNSGNSGNGSGGLAELSPKFAAVVTRLANAQGPTIVYSEFRKGEGIRLLAASLEANGFHELRLQRRTTTASQKTALEIADPTSLGAASAPRFVVYNNDDPEMAACMLALFRGQLDSEDGVPPGVISDLRDAGLLPTEQDSGNSGNSQNVNVNVNLRGGLVRALLITRSGAEGISTRNVREVHILEPFWHANRVQQVIGRARRAFSHDELPLAERTVDVYIYVATLTAEQAKEHPRDDGKTSDEFVHEVAVRKRRVLDALLDVMRRSAVDCHLHNPTNPSACYATPPGTPPDQPLYDMDLREDLRRDDDATAAAAAAANRTDQGASTTLVAVRVEGRMYYTDRATGILYDYNALKQRGEAREVGRINADDAHTNADAAQLQQLKK